MDRSSLEFSDSIRSLQLIARKTPGAVCFSSFCALFQRRFKEKPLGVGAPQITYRFQCKNRRHTSLKVFLTCFARFSIRSHSQLHKTPGRRSYTYRYLQGVETYLKLEFIQESILHILGLIKGIKTVTCNICNIYFDFGFNKLQQLIVKSQFKLKLNNFFLQHEASPLHYEFRYNVRIMLRCHILSLKDKFISHSES